MALRTLALQILRLVIAVGGRVMPNPDLEAEHAALLREQAELQKQCIDEWEIMPAQVARARQDRLWAIRDRLAVIERSATWRGRSAT